jgi:hypothetical protein
MNQKFKICIGFGQYVWHVLNHGAYTGGQLFYRDAQENPDGCEIALLESPLYDMMKDYQFLKENRDNSRLSSEAIRQYSDDTLSGYADKEFTKGGKTLEEQQRGLILPLLEKVISRQTTDSTIVEIGTGNGDVIAYLAKNYPMHNFIGVDFSVKNAIEKYGAGRNFMFVGGYALDLLDKGALKGDVVFASSTFCNFTPGELYNYIGRLKGNGFKEIILNEPFWSDYRQENNRKTKSRHLDGAVWFHNYCGYIRTGGYEMREMDVFHYQHPSSSRPDIKISLVHGVVI